MHAEFFMIMIPREGKLRGGFAIAGWDLETGFDIAGLIHQSPLVFPFFAWCVELDFPGLVEGFEPVRC
jgi:hypothetical protein